MCCVKLDSQSSAIESRMAYLDALSKSQCELSTFIGGLQQAKTCYMQEDFRNRKFLSVDSLIEKQQVLFRDMGRSGEWDPVFHTGNPADVGLEQAAYNVTITTTSGAINAIILYNGESAHLPRRGCAIALRLQRLTDT
ncbi:hypothetical protein MAR_035516 [Mya arenaria]|uniref:Uncharacterized protein n=1 Tax=Mya arenaria TaxID=6604 RepID=A0ABY7EKR3_MYAAR|nr:hypothetical protein MAR_035516 [Mya arenaria]